MDFDSKALMAWMRCVHERLLQERSSLDQLDTAIGDGDHGSNLSRGFSKVVEKLASVTSGTPGELLKGVAMTLIGSVGGASGPLYGTFFLETAKAMGSAATFQPEDLGHCLQSGIAGIQRLGKASAGDKTMLDALMPAVEVLVARGSFADAARAAEAGLAATIPLQARKGRASYLGARSIGHADPGAASAALLFTCLARAGD
ncbi:dihydroxyacetone kinase subunit DhaL [Acidithiobacillus sp. AMEEHan]|uniref:dihydroxyacetone kinase subunit DhaL n=1 Tax=Acidithiobacillus sp. AMEEHan TaxID=2994951 RepID=UPI0027E5154E|nr:dihydroxyacetone kinase subunit DhaL [Acidithiobacillus sp. AMEEHan]